MRRAPRSRDPDGSLGDAGRLRAQRQTRAVLVVSGALVALNLGLLLASPGAALVMAFYVGGLSLVAFLLSLWQWADQGQWVDFARAVAPRADRMHALAAGLDGGRVEEKDGQVKVRGRRGGVEVSARCWTAADPLPAEDALELRLPTQRPPPWRGAYVGLKTHPKGLQVPLIGGPPPSVLDLHVVGKDKPPLTRALRERLLPLLHVVPRAQLEVDAEGLVLRLGASPDAFAPGLAERCLDELVALGRALGVPLSDAPALDVTVRPADLEGAGHACPYCRAPVVDDAWRCGACQTEHHRACQAEHGGCTVLGCSGGPDRTRTRA
jgi:hypothetical protein